MEDILLKCNYFKVGNAEDTFLNFPVSWITLEKRHLLCLFPFPDILRYPAPSLKKDWLLLLSAGQSVKLPPRCSMITQVSSERLKNEHFPRLTTS